LQGFFRKAFLAEEPAMQAIVAHELGAADVLKAEEVARPRAGAGQVVVKLHAIGINPVDTYILAGKHGPRPVPYTPGKDGAGVVEEVGPGVADLKQGERVYVSNSISGTYAAYALCDAKDVHRLPGNASFAAGASVGVPAGVAYFALFYRGGARAGETVLVHGATGSVGSSALQFARAAGIRVFGTAGDDKGRAFVLAQGAHDAFDHNITQDEQRVKAATGGRGFDVIVENLADKNLASDLTALSERGRVLVIGSRGKIEIDPRQTMARNSDIRGVTLEKPTEEEHRGIYAGVTAGLESGILRPAIAMELPLAEAARGHKEVMGKHPPGKILLRPEGAEK
jgi:NADPH2:quinone reductase